MLLLFLKQKLRFVYCPFLMEIIEYFSVSVSQSMWVRPECRWEMPVGSCTASSMVSNQMVRCLQIKLSVGETTHSTLSSVRLERASTCQELYLSTLNQLLSVSCILITYLDGNFLCRDCVYLKV